MMPSISNFRRYVLSYPVDLCNKIEALNIIKECWQSNTDLHVITLNAEMIMTAQKDKRLKQIIQNSKLVIPDGAGVVQALKLRGYKTSRLPGIELAYSALELAAQNKISVALIGASPAVLNSLRHSLPQQIPDLNLVYCQDGYFDADQQENVMRAINTTHAQLVLVATGVPRQEYFIEQAFNSTKHTVFIGVGGSFDVWAGKIQRAPQVWQNFNLEWLYRLIGEPWRFKRMATTLPNFTCQVIFEYLNDILLKKSNK
jgi:N-acetylglucosaminyldiphosphoundecaprenol N-acetyl-beta-D-mannosaminyltransferase